MAGESTCVSLGGISQAARALGSFAALKGDVAKCVRLAKGPEGLLRCLRYTHGPGHMSNPSRKRRGAKRKYSYSTAAYRRRKGKGARPAAHRKGRRKGHRKGRRKGRRAA